MARRFDKDEHQLRRHSVYYTDENGKRVWAPHPDRENDSPAANEAWKQEQENWERGPKLEKNPVFADLFGFFSSYMENFSRPASEEELNDMVQRGVEFAMRKDPNVANEEKFWSTVSDAILGALQAQPASEGGVDLATLTPSTEIPEGMTEQLPGVEDSPQYVNSPRFPGSVGWN